jgi:hypothetical protein
MKKKVKRIFPRSSFTVFLLALVLSLLPNPAVSGMGLFLSFHLSPADSESNRYS